LRFWKIDGHSGYDLRQRQARTDERSPGRKHSTVLCTRRLPGLKFVWPCAVAWL